MKTTLAALALALLLAGCSSSQSGDSNEDNLQDTVPSTPIPTSSP